MGLYNLRGEACAFNCGSNGVSIEGIEGSTPPGDTKNFAGRIHIVGARLSTCHRACYRGMLFLVFFFLREYLPNR